MKLKKPINENYCATVVTIKNIVPLENCDNITSTIIFGNSIIIDKNTNIGDVGVYFPAETQLSHEYASVNNLYRHAELNTDPDKKGYIEDNRRIRTMKMRGNKSCGLFMPLESLSTFVEIDKLNERDIFDELDDVPICNKYIVKKKNSQGPNKKKGKTPKLSKLIDGQFRLHQSTSHFGKSAHIFKPNDMVSITKKMHGTSVVISKVLCKKKLGIIKKILKAVGIDIVDTEYDNIYSSRKVIKNDDLNQNKNSYYEVDIWGLANNKIKEFLVDGLTVYAEIVGYLPNGAYIQKPFDYGCGKNQWEVYIYRITYTNTAGHVFEFSNKQIQDWCFERGLEHVPELFYGPVHQLIHDPEQLEENDGEMPFHEVLIDNIRTSFLEKRCDMCANNVPDEGIVIRKEGNAFDVFKFKSFKFLEFETKQIDKGTEDIEEDN